MSGITYRRNTYHSGPQAQLALRVSILTRKARARVGIYSVAWNLLKKHKKWNVFGLSCVFNTQFEPVFLGFCINYTKSRVLVDFERKETD